jgi:hydroxypyruvate reductase
VAKAPSLKSTRKLRANAKAIFRAALEASSAGNAVERHVRLSGRGRILRIGSLSLKLNEFDRIFVVGAGKAGASMAAALERILGPENISGGLINVKHGHTRPAPKAVCLHECGHPLPDQPGLDGAHRIEDLLRELNARDLLFVLISGGASALLPAPASPLTLADKQQTTDLLLRAGADIFELNAVRKHLSALKGGQLAALAYPATVVSLLLSDVIGDPLDVIGSGPTAPDSSTFEEALRVLAKYGLSKRVPAAVFARLERGAEGRLPETPKPGDAIFSNVTNFVIGSNRLALDAAAQAARSLGYRTLILSSTMQGETREVARVYAEILREIVSSGHPLKRPACLLSGGETTVTVRGKGKGGRNQEFALAAALSLSGIPDIAVLSAGTDGTDGPTDAAGALADGETVSRAVKLGLLPADHLMNNDAYPFFEALGDLVKTGSTGTNVMDLHILLAG